MSSKVRKSKKYQKDNYKANVASTAELYKTISVDIKNPNLIVNSSPSLYSSRNPAIFNPIPTRGSKCATLQQMPLKLRKKNGNNNYKAVVASTVEVYRATSVDKKITV